MNQKILILLLALTASSGLMSAANGIGKFSVSATQQVTFSPGNLQYNAALGTHQCADGSTQQGTWRFAPNQWDYVGEGNNNISSTYDGWIDLFGWGTSGWKSGAVAYLPWSTSPTNSDYYPGGNFSNNLTDNYAKADWGVYNQIGDVAPGTWRTLTCDEWVYLFHDRSNAENLFGLGTVNGVPGAIILPDGWQAPSGVTFIASAENGLSWQGSYYSQSGSNHYNDNAFVSGPSGTWDAMATSGAVFLPASGTRFTTAYSNNTTSFGLYWSSSTTFYGTRAYYLNFNTSQVYLRHNYDERSSGIAVRLVSDLTTSSDPEPCILASGTCGAKGDNLTWELSCEGVLTISGTGEMEDYYNHAPWYELRESITSVVINNGVTNVSAAAFNNCTNLITVNLPNSITNIGVSAFAVCENLSNINIPNSVTYIGESAFVRCYSLTSIEIPEGVEIIRPYTFNSCNSLVSVIIPNSVTGISTSSFTGCSSLTSIDIPNSVTMIDHYSFANCTGLTSISIPNSVTSIGSQAFLKCQGLNSISVEAGNTVYDSREDCNAIIETASNTLITGCKNTIIPNSVTSIENWAFQFCEGLASVEIPNSVTSIGIRAFDLCTGLTSITCEAVNPPTLGQEVFYEIDKSIPLYVPAESVDDYKAADQWKDFNVQAIKNCTIETTDGTTVWEDELPFTWEDKTFTEAGTQTTTLKNMDGCDSVVTFTLRVRYNNIVLQENESSEYYDLFAKDYNGYTVTTATLNRQFTQGKWATLCLPFNVNKAMMMSLGLYNRVFAFRYAQQLDDETIQVFFTPAQSIEAGKGYIVNANAKLAQKTSFVFPNVTINTDSDNGDITALTGYNDGTGRGNLFLVGTLRTGILQGTTTGNTYLGLKDNQLYYPNTTSGTSIRAYRGFFRSDIPVNAQRVRIVAEGETVTELEVMNGEEDLHEALPARKYLRNGLLYIERNGITYTAQGQRID